MPSPRAPLCLLACEPAAALGRSIAGVLGVALTPSRDVWFSCGEGKHVLGANVRGTDVYVLQRASVPGNAHTIYDRLLMALHAADAASLADAGRVTLVLPYLPGGRQDKRKDHAREGVSTGLFARMIAAAGVSMVITVEPHNEAMVAAFDPRHCVLESVSLTASFASFLSEQGFSRDVVASTDVGGIERARGYAQRLERPIVALSKERDYSRPSVVARTTVIGEVVGKSVLIIDDIVDTAGSVASAVRSLWEAGATDIAVAGAHMLLSRPGWDRLHDLSAEASARGRGFAVVGTSAIEHVDTPPWYTEFRLDALLAGVIRSVNTRGSVRALE